MTFLTARGNAIHEFAGNILTVGTASHQIQGLGSLELGKIGRNSAAEISATENGLSISLKGTAGVIQVDGSDARPSWAEALKARADVNAWLTTAILIGTTILTVLSRLKIVQLQEKS